MVRMKDESLHGFRTIVKALLFVEHIRLGNVGLKLRADFDLALIGQQRLGRWIIYERVEKGVLKRILSVIS